jgi:hypothetical protein
MSLFRINLIPLTLVVVAACGSGAGAPPSTAAAPARVEPNAAELRADLVVFAADSFRGRETGTPDADRAAQWLAARLATLGLEPGGDSGYFHRVPMQRTKTAAKELTVTSPTGKTSLTLGRDIAILASLGPGIPLPKLSADADVVFAGYGLVDPALPRDDYAGLDVAGKVVVIAGVAPPGLDSAKRAALENPQLLFTRLNAAIMKQPAAVILLLPDSVYRLAAGQFSGTQIELAAPQAASAPRVLPLVAVAVLRPGSPFLPAGWPTPDAAKALAGTRLKAEVEVSPQNFNGYNVVGIVRGSDSVLRNSYVAYGAHYDHIGIQTPAANGDSIANGADDDASGSVALLAIARAWTQGPKPKRSALFVWHVGEEKGLFGSQVFTDHSTVPIDSIVAQLNADMIGRNSPDSLYIVGPGAAPNGQSRPLGAIIDSVNSAMPKPFVFNREWDTTTHPERIYFRSDHFNYARKGIPIVFFTTGLHPQYHQVTDEAGLINYDKLAQVGALMYRAGVVLGNRTTRPKPEAVQ